MKVLALLLLLTFSSCSVFDNEQDIEHVEVLTTTNGSSFTVLNKSDTPIIYLFIETNTAAVIDLAISCDDFQPNLPQKSSVKVNYSDIMGWDEVAESVWFYWTDCNGSGDSKTIKL